MKTINSFGIRIFLLCNVFFFTFMLAPSANGQFTVIDIPHTIVNQAAKFIQSASFADLVDGVKKLEQISNIVRQAKRGIELASESTKLVGKINTISTVLASDKHILDFEYDNITTQFGGLAKEVGLAVKDLSNIVQTNGTTMDDAGRLDLINQAYGKVTKINAKLSAIYSHYAAVSRARSNSASDLSATSRLYSAGSATIAGINNKTVKGVGPAETDPYSKPLENVDLAKEKAIREAIANEAANATGRISAIVSAQERIKRSEFQLGAALSFPLRSDGECKKLDELAEDLLDDFGEAAANVAFALAEKCHSDVDNHNDIQKAQREAFVDRKMAEGDWINYYQKQRTDQLNAELVKIYAKYGKTYTILNPLASSGG